MIRVVTITVLFFIQCQADMPPPQTDFDQSKILGTWYGIAAASNCNPFMEMKKQHMPTPVIVFSVHGGHLRSSTGFQTDKGCQEMDLDMVLIANGRYKYETPYGDTETVFPGTDYDTFLMDFSKSQKDANSCIAVKLFVRKGKNPEATVQQFRDHLKDVGLSEENYFRFHDEATCLPTGA